MQTPHMHDANPASVVSIGNFDGVHVGHLRILREAAEDAQRRGLASVALTFEPHPVEVFRALRAEDFRLTSPAHRRELLMAAGVGRVVEQVFDRGFAALSAEEFVDRVLVGELRAVSVHVGYDFNFGSGRSGTPDVLRALGAARGFELHVHEAVRLGGEPVSSTRVRQAIRDGDLALAQVLLGRPYSLMGMPAAGHGRGRTLSFPTINHYPQRVLTPPRGVYVSRLACGAESWMAVSNLGVRPTFGDDVRLSLETHILEPFEGLRPDTHIDVSLLAPIRPERRFESPDQLREQIAVDVSAARDWHSAAGQRAPG
jgi:riboflavin kinase/FMN adenylyltransferase